MNPPDPKAAAAKTRAVAAEKTEQVRYLRFLLGHAMREEADALKAAREADQVVARG